MRRGDAAAAVRAFVRRCGPHPGDATLRLWLATAQLQLGDAEAADASLAGASRSRAP
ncbi:MAG: tetratricopeptide repeat protein [Nannocystaceae bacterium]